MIELLKSIGIVFSVVVSFSTIYSKIKDWRKNKRPIGERGTIFQTLNHHYDKDRGYTVYKVLVGEDIFNYTKQFSKVGVVRDLKQVNSYYLVELELPGSPPHQFSITKS